MKSPALSEKVLDDDAAHGSPERDLVFPRGEWDRAQEDLAGLTQVLRQLASRHGGALLINSGGRYPWPARIIERKWKRVTVTLKLAPAIAPATGAVMPGYELGYVVRTVPRNPLRALFHGASYSWHTIGVLGGDHVRAAAPAVVATLERAAMVAFGAPSPPS